MLWLTRMWLRFRWMTVDQALVVALKDAELKALRSIVRDSADAIGAPMSGARRIPVMIVDLRENVVMRGNQIKVLLAEVRLLRQMCNEVDIAEVDTELERRAGLVDD